jgi:excisionase family DNA binding protein
MDMKIGLELGDLLTIPEAADLLRCKPSTVRAWLTQSRLSRVKVGRLTRILRQDLEAFIRAGRVQEPNDEH